MDRGWIEDGSIMDRGWIEDGSRMDRGWIEDGSRMDRGWIGDGPSLVYPSLARILELQDFEFRIPELYAPPVLTPKSTRITYNYKTDWHTWQDPSGP